MTDYITTRWYKLIINTYTYIYFIMSEINLNINKIIGIEHLNNCYAFKTTILK